jgi:hypothetical protein
VRNLLNQLRWLLKIHLLLLYIQKLEKKNYVVILWEVYGTKMAFEDSFVVIVHSKTERKKLGCYFVGSL